MTLSRLLRSAFACTVFTTTAWLGATPIEFTFNPPSSEENPFSREIWARVETPSEQLQLLPAFYIGEGNWSVRTRAAEKGNYRFLNVTEIVGGQSIPLRVELFGRDRVKPRDLDPLDGNISIDPSTGRDFVDGSGNLYLPIGGSLPWAPDSPENYYPSAFTDMKSASFNWTRIWMCHWGQLNLDWIESHHGEQPELGTLSLEVADRWDQIIELAENHGVRIQVVLQHHGQYSTSSDSNWAENPWNTALGGFLDTPESFFTDEQARQLTRDKFRYIVARWGYSSTILAWELFNESMWTKARQGDAASNQAVADWHTEMARHLRRFDVHDHLVTTSDDDLHHALWSAMDYYQPHLYGDNMVLGVQSLEINPTTLDRPIFYGEIGVNNMSALTDEQRTSGFGDSVLAWSGLFGPSGQPAQLWDLESIRQNDRWSAMQSLGAFVRASGLSSHPLPEVAQLTVVGGDVAPASINPGFIWHQGPDPTLDVALHGRLQPELMAFRSVLTNAAAIPTHPYPSKLTLNLNFPASATARLRVNRIGNLGSSLRVSIDGKAIVDESWPAAAPGRPTPSNLEFPFRIGYGKHQLIIENPTGTDWIDLGGLDLGVDAPVLTATSRRGHDRLVLWVQHRTNLFSPSDDDELSATSARLQIPELAAGDWQVTWWDIANGRPTSSKTIEHRGGPLALATPEILRHTAAWIEPVR